MRRPFHRSHTLFFQETRILLVISFLSHEQASDPLCWINLEEATARNVLVGVLTSISHWQDRQPDLCKGSSVGDAARCRDAQCQATDRCELLGEQARDAQLLVIVRDHHEQPGQQLVFARPLSCLDSGTLLTGVRESEKGRKEEKAHE